MKYVLYNQAQRQWATRAIKEVPVGSEVRIRTPDGRTLEQNSLMWDLLTDISAQVRWHDRILKPHQWKLLLSAGLLEADVVPSLDGKAFVVLGLNTSDLNKTDMSALIDLCFAFGAEHGVEWSKDYDTAIHREGQGT